MNLCRKVDYNACGGGGGEIWPRMSLLGEGCEAVSTRCCLAYMVQRTLQTYILTIYLLECLFANVRRALKRFGRSTADLTRIQS